MTWTVFGLRPPAQTSRAKNAPRGTGWRRVACTDKGPPQCLGAAARGDTACTCGLNGWARNNVPRQDMEKM